MPFISPLQQKIQTRRSTINFQNAESKPLCNWPSLWHYIMFQGSVRDRQQMYDFLPWTCTCSTCGEGQCRDTEEEENRSASPRWWPIMWRWELKWEQRSSSRADKWNALQRDAAKSLHAFINALFVSWWKSQGSEIIGNSLKMWGGGWGGGVGVIFEQRGRQLCVQIKRWERTKISLSSSESSSFPIYSNEDQLF